MIATSPELGVLDRLVRPGSVVVDVGANYGIYTCVLARLVGPAGRVYAFEPAAEAAEVLRRNVLRNRLGWVEVIQAGCADFSGHARLRHEPDPSRNALELAAGPEPSEPAGPEPFEPIEVLRLDDLVAEASLVKIDVEGAEELVLRGATRLLERSRPVVLFEVNHEGAQRLSLKPEGACYLLAELGYRFFRARAGNLVAHEVAGIAPPSGNVVALPAGFRVEAMPSR